MSFIRREIYTKDKNIQHYLDRLLTNNSVEVPPQISFELSRYKTIQKLRNTNHRDPPILIANDRTANKSIIMIRKPLTIKKEGDRYYFDL